MVYICVEITYVPLENEIFEYENIKLGIASVIEKL